MKTITNKTALEDKLASILDSRDKYQEWTADEINEVESIRKKLGTDIAGVE